MDPTGLGFMSVAGVIALFAVLLEKGITFIKWMFDRAVQSQVSQKVEVPKPNGSSTTRDLEDRRRIEHVAEQVDEIHGIVIVRGIDGRPLVYTSDAAALDHSREIKLALDRCLEKIEDLEKKFSDHDAWERARIASQATHLRHLG